MAVHKNIAIHIDRDNNQILLNCNNKHHDISIYDIVMHFVCDHINLKYIEMFYSQVDVMMNYVKTNCILFKTRKIIPHNKL